MDLIYDCHTIKKYINNKKYVFKSCQIYWIVVLKILNDTRTTQKRDGVYNNKYAKFRGDKFEVVHIFNKLDPSITIQSVVNSMYVTKQLEYCVGQIVDVSKVKYHVFPFQTLYDKFDENINIVCSSGIHFYENIEPAYYCELNEIICDGRVKFWYGGGALRCCGDYKNGKHDGNWIYYAEDGSIESKVYYKNDYSYFKI